MKIRTLQDPDEETQLSAHAWVAPSITASLPHSWGRAGVGENQMSDSIQARVDAAYLEAAIDDGDQGVLILALRHVAFAQAGATE